MLDLYWLKSAIGKRKPIVILDDLFPHPISSFRYSEFNYLLENMKDLDIYCDGSALHCVNNLGSIEDLIESHRCDFPKFAHRVKQLDPTNFPAASLYYSIFINCIKPYISLIEDRNSRFVLTLYPGGGFYIDDKQTDLDLARLLGSKSFEKVIVTQKITREYLLRKGFCDPERIFFNFGGVVAEVKTEDFLSRKRYFRNGKNTVDIAFVANRYSETGVEKGYDIFVESAKAIAAQYEEARFHVVGNYDASVINVSELGEKIKFYGFQSSSFFDHFYRDVDILVSPNRPFQGGPGLFDGFPTGAAVEAVLHGVALVCTDPLNSNISFKSDRDIVIIDATPDHTTRAVCELIEHPRKLIGLATRGARRFAHDFGRANQLEPRRKLLTHLR